MARRSGIYVTNGGTLDALIDSLKAFRDAGPEIASEALDGALKRTEELSRSLAHTSHDRRHTGALKASIRSSSEGYPGGWVGYVEAGEPDAVPQKDHQTGAFWELQRGGDHAAFVDALAEGSAEWFAEALNQWFDTIFPE